MQHWPESAQGTAPALDTAPDILIVRSSTFTEPHNNGTCCECERSFCEVVTGMWLPLQLAAEVTYTCFPLLCIYLLLAQIDTTTTTMRTLATFTT